MSGTKHHTKSGFPFRAVILTAIITLAVSAGIAYFTGYLGPTHDMSMISQDMGEKSGAEAEAMLYSCGMHPWVVSKEPGNCPICGMKLTPKLDEDTRTAQSKKRKIAYWRAPMNPTEIYDKPGKSAMGMDLVPVYENEISGGTEIRIDPVTQQNMGIRTATVSKGPLVRTIRTYGHVTYDETRIAQINLKFSGWIEKLYVDFTGQQVKSGQPLFDIYSPELITAQGDYLEAYQNQKRYPSRTNQRMLASVRRRLTYYNIGDPEIREIEKSQSIKQALTIRTPFKGVVTVNHAIEGGYVKAGTTIYEIADLSRVWVEAHIYEYELPWIAPGLEAQMTLPYLPGSQFNGRVTYVYPYLQKKTRDVVIRLEFENPDLELKPDMYANVYIKTAVKGEGIRIPSEAVIRSGKRNVVFVTAGDGKFIPRDVTLGMSLDDGMVRVLKGLAPGETVVTSGQFLLDSESNLREATQKMLEERKGGKRPVKKTKPEDDFFSDME